MPEPKAVVYLLRHAHDYGLTPEQEKDGKEESDLWDRPAGGGNFHEDLPGGGSVEFPWKRLDQTGQDQAECIKGFVANAATENGKYAPIHHYVAQDPSGRDNSQNTFYTVWPAVNLDKGAATINLLGKDGFKEKDIMELLTKIGTESVMICLDRQHLWGYERLSNGEIKRDGDGKKIKQPYDKEPDEQSILGKLNKALGEKLTGKLTGPEKGGIIYKFTTSDDGQNLKISSLYLDRSGTTFNGVKNQKEII